MLERIAVGQNGKGKCNFLMNAQIFEIKDTQTLQGFLSKLLCDLSSVNIFWGTFWKMLEQNFDSQVIWPTAGHSMRYAQVCPSTLLLWWSKAWRMRNMCVPFCVAKREHEERKLFISFFFQICEISLRRPVATVWTTVWCLGEICQKADCRIWGDSEQLSAVELVPNALLRGEAVVSF